MMEEVSARVRDLCENGPQFIADSGPRGRVARLASVHILYLHTAIVGTFKIYNSNRIRASIQRSLESFHSTTTQHGWGIRKLDRSLR